MIAMVAGGSEEWWDDPRARFAISAAVGAFILLVTFFDPLFSALVIRRRVRRGQYAVTLNPTRIEVTPACVRTIDLPSNATQEWPSIRTIRLSQSGGIVYLPTGSVLLIPRRCFATDAAFMDFLESINRLPRDGR